MKSLGIGSGNVKVNFQVNEFKRVKKKELNSNTSSFKISKLSHHIVENIMKEVAEKQLWSFEIKLNKEETYCDPYIMDVNLAKKGHQGHNNF